MLALYLAAGLIVTASAVLGQAIWAACRFERGSYLAPAVGFAALLTLAALLIDLPGRATTTAIVTLVLVLAAVAWRRGRLVGAAALRVGWPAALLALVLVGLPFAVSGRVGLLGVGDNNDFSAHLSAVWWLQAHVRPEPPVVKTGYPLGPHALVAALATGVGFSRETAFDAILLAVPALAAVTALAALREGRAATRVALAALVALPYLAASYFAEGAFKETILGLLVLAFALTLRALVRGPRPVGAARGVPLGLLGAGGVATYSYPALAWPVATALLWLALAALLGLLARRRAAPRGALAGLRAGAPAGLAAAATLAVGVGPTIPSLVSFAGSSFTNAPTNGLGNLVGHISLAELFGVWFQSDFRFAAPSAAWATAFVVLAIVACAGALVWWLGRRDLVVPAAVGAGALVYWQATKNENPYNAAKALAVLAPLLMLTVARPAAALAGRAWTTLRPRPRAGTARGVALTRLAGALGAVTLGAAAYSSFLALRDAPIGPSAHPEQLAVLRHAVGRRPTIFFGNDDFIVWELHGAPVAKAQPIYFEWLVPVRPPKRSGLAPVSLPERSEVPGLALDFDSFGAATLDRFRYAIAPRTPYASAPPPNWRQVGGTADYTLWQRSGPTPARGVLTERGNPGALLRCDTPAGQALSRRAGLASVVPAPVLGAAAGWRGAARAAGQSASRTLVLGRGTWDLSLQYVSREGLRVRAPGLDARLPAALERLGPFWRLGTLRVARRAPVRITVSAQRLPWFGRLLGARGKTYALNSPGNRPLGAIAATRHVAPSTLVPLRRACGRYVDFYRLGG